MKKKYYTLLQIIRCGNQQIYWRAETVNDDRHAEIDRSASDDDRSIMQVSQKKLPILL